MADKGKKIKEEDDHILYNLLVHAEWNLEGEVLNKDSLDILQQKGSLGKKLLSIVEVSLWNFWKLVKYPFRGFGNVCVLPEELIKLSESPQTWDISLSSDGNFLAVLQEQCIEIRTAKDNFSSIVSKCQVTKDASPRWRKLSWNGDGSLLAFAYSSGEVLIFDLSGTGLCSLKDSTSSNIYSGSPFSHGNAIAGLIFIKRNNSTKSFLELIIISYQGYLRSYIINGTSGEHEKKYTFSFPSVLPYGVSSAVYYPMNKLLILGSPGTYDSRATSGKSGIESGITMWRLLSDHPHFKLIEDQALELKKTQQEAGFCRKFLPARSGNKQNGVWKMSLSLDNKALLVLHFSGRLSLWELPSLKLRKSWERGDQPEYKSEEVNLHFPGLNTKKRRGHDENFLYDIGWWSSEAVVLARSSGAITVSTVKKSLQNILGQYAEWCEPLPLVTSANNGGFLILECENAIVSSSPVRKAVFDEGNKGTHEDDDDDEEHHVMTKTKELTKHVLYFLTESERFRPPVRRPKILKQTYRLLCLRSTTPEELYARKIELEEYGEALALAQSYGLDCDLVYQKQWRKSKVTVSSIHDYLSKVTKRIWVLHECLERVPENLDSAKALLKYGLHGTGVQVLIAIGKKQAEHPFIRDECDGKGDDEEERRDREDEKRLLRSIDFHNLSVEQRNICRYRLRFLKYLDRLSTYETILGGPAVAHDAFDSGFFTTFRDSNIVETTVEYARDNDWNAVDCLLTYHSKETIPHYLAVLSNFPETTNPFDYRSLLPEAGVRPGEPEVYEWEQKTWRTQDWVENPMYFKEVEGEAEADSGEFLYAENPQLRKFSNELTGNLLSQWYKYRAQEIERTSSQVDNALELVKLGKERGVKGLVSLYDELLTLSVAVYECQGDGHVDLESLQKLTNLEQMKLLVSKFSEQTFIKDFKKWIIPFLDRAEKRSRGNKLKLIQQFMVDSAKIDLTYPLKILEQSSSELFVVVAIDVTEPQAQFQLNAESHLKESLVFGTKVGVNEPIIPDVAQQMRLAIDCIYLCSRDDQFDKANLILKCFSSEVESILSEQIRELSGKIKEVEVHLQGAKILLANGFAKPVSYLLDTKADKKAAQSLMQTLSKIAKNREPPLQKAEWDKFLADLLKLRDKIFNCIPRTVCYQIFMLQKSAVLMIQRISLIAMPSFQTTSLTACAECLLGSGNKENIKHAEQLLCCRPGISQKDDKVDYTKSVEMVVSAAREYFNAANDVNDPSMKLAKACLELVPLSEPTVKEELNFISALSLLAEFNVSILPLQVRLCQDKAELIAKSLDSCPSAYKDPPQLLYLAALLQLSGSDEKTRRGRVLSMVAEKALQCSDITVACDACAELMKSSYIPGWKVCRRKLLDFSLTHCDPNAVESLMRSRSLLQTEILYGKISDLMAKVGDPVNLDELSTTEHISKTTKAIISNVSDVSWWKNTLHWVRPLNRGSLERKGDEEMSVKEEATLEYRCHPFYDTVHSKQQLNQRDIHEHSGKSDETLLRVSELLLQTQKLAEERAEGSIEEPATEVLLQLASACLKKDSSLSLAYLLALPEFTNAYECFEKLPSCALTLQFASYYYALQIYNETNPQVQEHQSSLYFHPPDHVIEHVIRCSRACPEIYDDVKFLLVHLKRYHTQLSDFSQAKLLQKLGRGVDIGRFTQDEEYKRETILGLTMSVEEDIFNTAISLAQRYDISKWEMIMSHLEWLFTDSELSTKQLQDRVNEKQMMETLLEQPENVVSRLKEYIYPAIDGKQLARLLYYYMLHSDCIQRGGISSAGESDPQMHIRLIKKIKAASQGVDYKNLMDGNNPLEALRPHLISTNVHVFAKMANKLRYKDGAVLTPSHVFKVFGEKTFWEGEGKVIAKEVDWIHRYEVVHGYLERLNCQDLIDLIDSFTFSEKAIDTLIVDIRDDIVRRALKFSRQKIGKQRKKSKGDIFEGSVEISDVVAHFEQSLKHLASLDNDIIARLEESELNQHRDYARLYDLSRSEPQRIKDLCVQVLCNGDSLEMVKDILNLANQQCTQCIKTRDILKEALRIILNLYSHPDERPSYLPKDERPSVFLKRLLATLPQTESPTRKLVKDEHILEVIRAFCADETVPAGVKPEVLHLLESFLHLTGEDRMLLLYHQTNAIVHNNWDIALNIEDVQSTEKRHRLFVQIFTSSKNNKQMLSVASLLNIWPPLEGRHEGERAWYLVLLKLIQDFEDGVSVVNLVKEQNCITHLDKRDRQRLLDVLFERSSHLLAFKFGLLVGDEEMFQFVVNQMKDLQPDGSTCDNEFLELIFKNKLSANIVNTQFFSVYVNYMLQEDACGDSSRESRVNRVVHELQDVGHTIEAASIRASLEYLHPGLRTLDTAIGALFRWMGKS